VVVPGGRRCRLRPPDAKGTAEEAPPRRRRTLPASLKRFIEDNWKLGRIGGGSFDAIAGELWPLFDFDQRGRHPLFLDPSTGEVVAHEPDAE
jgi:hypothetical protein